MSTPDYGIIRWTLLYRWLQNIGSDGSSTLLVLTIREAWIGNGMEKGSLVPEVLVIRYNCISKDHWGWVRSKESEDGGRFK